MEQSRHYKGLTDAEVLESYRYGYRNIAIASWLQRLVEAAGAPCELIHNGFDFDFFRMSVDYTRKERCRVAMLYHTSEWKGCRYGFEALRIVRERCPELKVSLFGVPPAPALRLPPTPPSAQVEKPWPYDDDDDQQR